MNARQCRFLAGFALLAVYPLYVQAGMGTPLPTDTAFVRRLNDSVLFRLQAISFFLAVLSLCALAVQRLWNLLRRDFPRLPRLSYGKALAGVFLWGLLFVIVLAMISGARELMTPGAWQKQGWTYKLDTPSGTGPEADSAARRQHLERLRTALWHFAATHNGRFPTKSEMVEIPSDLWTVPDTGGMRYLYVPGLSVRGPVALLACEPELDPENRQILRTNGDLGSLRSAEIGPIRTTEKVP